MYVSIYVCVCIIQNDSYVSQNQQPNQNKN